MNRIHRRYLLLSLGLIILMALLPGMVVQADFGTNWVGTYYNTVDLSGPVIDTGTYPNGLNLNFGTGQPVDIGAGRVMSGVLADGFSARFVSTQTFTGGDYTFTLSFEAGARLYIDGAKVFDQFSPAPLRTVSFVQNVAAGNHQLIVEYVDAAGPDSSGAILQVQWNLGGAAVPTPTSAPAATATVHTVKGLAVRTGPYLGASMITIARPGNTYSVSAKNASEGIYTWYLITVGDQTGWSSGRYLTVSSPDAVPAQSTVFDTIDGAPDIGVVAIPRAIMNLRIRPSYRTQRLAQVPWGAEVPLIGRTIQGGRNFWFQVRYNGMVGWIYAPYVTVHGPLDAVPIR